MDEPERQAFLKSDPEGPYIRQPPPPHMFQTFITPDSDLFQTIHMGAAVVDHAKWILVIDGLVQEQRTFTLQEIQGMPQTTITAFHECYGSPVKPPTTNVWRIGNVRWTGVRLSYLLALGSPLPEASYVWSEGLDRGEFFGIKADRYQKDLPLHKALNPEVLVAYKMNDQPLEKNRGGPIRLVVPGWFGTNSTKWLCKISLQSCRNPGPFTTKLYNEEDPSYTDGRKRPVWTVEPNSLIVTPKDGTTISGPEVQVEGWAWSDEGITAVSICVQEHGRTVAADVQQRVDYSWQKFTATVSLPSGSSTLFARASTSNSEIQPLEGRRNHVHRVQIQVV